MHSKSEEKAEHGITIRLPADGNLDVEPCGIIPLAGIPSFWRALGLNKDWYEDLLERWTDGEVALASPKFPVLSQLAEMHIDISRILLNQVPALIEELEAGRANCIDPQGLAVFEALRECAIRALRESKGLVLSPCA